MAARTGMSKLSMSDLEQLKSDLLAQASGADDLAALESVRVHALGKQGNVTALLKTKARASMHCARLSPTRSPSARPLSNLRR
jgi:phenylalanyl-tRNA synthetase alpha subunit